METGDEVPTQEVFDILSEEVRVEILQVLVDQLKGNPENPTLGFADLRRAVGMRDSGNFNYHLQKLTGTFVTKTDDGYSIGPAGLNVVAALITGVYGEDSKLGPLELDDQCPACDEPFTASYESGLLAVECPNGHEFRNALPPGAVDDRPLSGIIELLTLKTRQDMELALEGICPSCYAHLDWTADIDVDSEMPEVETQCHRCGIRLEVPIVRRLVQHPTVAMFYHDHAIDVQKRPLWAPEFYDAVEVSRAPDSEQLQVQVELEGETLTATLDDSLDILELQR